MTELIKTSIKGLKCDTKGCDYRDMSVEFSDYQRYLDAPCPLCGGNLLTKSDYDAIVKSLKAVRFINKIGRMLGIKPSNEPLTKYEVQMNGTGKNEN